MDDRDLGRLAERDYQTWVEGFADSPGVTVSRTDLLARWSDVRHEYLTGVFGAWLRPADADARIRVAIADLGHDGRPFTWTVWPSDTPHDLTARLVAAGFEDEGAGPVMARDLADPTGTDEPPPDGLVVRQATSESDVATIAAFALGSLGDVDAGVTIFGETLARVANETQPRFRLFGGWLDDRLVASSGLYTGSGVAGIYAVATDEAHRGRGFGRALTAAAMAAGRDAGLATAVLLASELGEPVYRRLGYRAVGEVRFLRWPGDLPASGEGVR